MSSVMVQIHLIFHFGLGPLNKEENLMPFSLKSCGIEYRWLEDSGTVSEKRQCLLAGLETEEMCKLMTKLAASKD
jgi:hypothetical protein